MIWPTPMGNSLAPLFGLEQPTWFHRLGGWQPLSRCNWSQPPQGLSLLLPSQESRIERLLSCWRHWGISGWNPRHLATPPEQPFVLLANRCQAQRMERFAYQLYPNDSVLDLAHQRQHPAPLLATASAMVTKDWRWGLEALIWKLPVHGLPHLPSSRRWQLALLHRWLLEESTYWDPTRRQACEPEQIIELVGLQLQQRRRFPVRIEAFGIHPFHHRTLRYYLAGSQLHFRHRHARPSRKAQASAVLGRALNKQALQPEERPLIQLEDGFLRSSGRGAHLQLPLSLAVDAVGIYFDATCPSALETFLQEHCFNVDECVRAQRLRSVILSASLSKYNLKGQNWIRPYHDKPVVLVVGQVEQDASIRYGAPGIRTNLALATAARRLEPEAHLIYKPHPFVANGRRPAGEGEGSIPSIVDAVLPDIAIDTLLNQVDRIHVLTSGTGFEALLREVPVVCHGLPFYAGWGLTMDQLQCERRGRKLTLDELVFGALMAYPSYVNQRCGWFITPEQAVDHLIALQASPPSRLALSLQHLAAFMPIIHS
jgi:capsular polysaccharide export protein